MSSKLIFLQGIQLASRLCHQRTPNFRASVLRRSVSEKKSTPSSSDQDKRGDKEDQPGVVKKINQSEIDKLDSPEKIKDRIQQLAKNIAITKAKATMAKEHTTKFEDRTETRFQWMMAFGVGTVLLGVGGTIMQVYYYNISQEDRMRLHVQDVSGKLEKVLMSQIENAEKVTTTKIDHFDNKLDSCLDRKKK